MEVSVVSIAIVGLCSLAVFFLTVHILTWCQTNCSTALSRQHGGHEPSIEPGIQESDENPVFDTPSDRSCKYGVIPDDRTLSRPDRDSADFISEQMLANCMQITSVTSVSQMYRSDAIVTLGVDETDFRSES
jgi:hypothetical protein